MIVTINGESRELAGSSSVADLLQQLGLAELRLAVERNRKVVPRDQFESTLLADGDALEIVTLVGGG